MSKSSPKCHLHPHEPCVAVCAICGENLCENCSQPFMGMQFCSNHFELAQKNEWGPITNVLTTPDTHEASSSIYQFKKYIWEKDQTPVFIRCEYKLNFEKNIIESYVKLYVMNKAKIQLARELEDFQKEEK